MNPPARRIGDFTVLSQPMLYGCFAIIAILAGVYLCWARSLRGELSWLVAYAAMAAGVVGVLAIIGWLGSKIVWWVELGETLRYATTFGGYEAKLGEIQGIYFEGEKQGVHIPLTPIMVVTNVRVHALIVLSTGRMLQGIVDAEEAMLLQKLLQREPRLNVKLQVALATPRRAMMTFIESLTDGRDLSAAECLDLSAYPTAERQQVGPDLARQLKERIEEAWRIDFYVIPDDADADSPFCLDTIEDIELSMEDRQMLAWIQLQRDPVTGMWRFNAATVQAICKDIS